MLNNNEVKEKVEAREKWGREKREAGGKRKSKGRKPRKERVVKTVIHQKLLTTIQN
jgi:hypothetical protein